MEDIVQRALAGDTGDFKANIQNPELLAHIKAHPGETLELLFMNLYFETILESALQGDPSDLKMYIQLGGSDHLYAVLKDHPRFADLKAIIHGITHMPIDYVVGCRSPDSKHARDGAFIVLKSRDGIHVSYFEDDVDFTGHPPEKSALHTYREYLRRGWTPMTVEDLRNTTGIVTIAEENNQLPRKRRHKYKIAACIAAIGLAYLIM